MERWQGCGAHDYVTSTLQHASLALAISENTNKCMQRWKTLLTSWVVSRSKGGTCCRGHVVIYFLIYFNHSTVCPEPFKQNLGFPVDIKTIWDCPFRGRRVWWLCAQALQQTFPDQTLAVLCPCCVNLSKLLNLCKSHFPYCDRDSITAPAS